jgi:hypothetical protein
MAPGRNEKCADCMVHCGYEASAVEDTFGSFSGFAKTVKITPVAECALTGAKNIVIPAAVKRFGSLSRPNASRITL